MSPINRAGRRGSRRAAVQSAKERQNFENENKRLSKCNVFAIDLPWKLELTHPNLCSAKNVRICIYLVKNPINTFNQRIPRPTTSSFETISHK